MMDSDEREIYYYLKGFREQFISAHEVCRRAAGKKRYHNEPDWAKPILARMAERRILETDPAGHYRIKPREVRSGGQTQRWVSPHIQKILSSSGKDYSEVIKIDDDLDAYYEKL